MPQKPLAIAILALSAAVCGEALARSSPPGGLPRAPGFTPWTFREDFSQGIPGWVSFPLPQDVGYDPTIYPTQVAGSPALVRDATPRGERVLRIGMARPIIFHVTPSSAFRIVYNFETCGKIVGRHSTLWGGGWAALQPFVLFPARRP